jgi:hypothetical protein
LTEVVEPPQPAPAAQLPAPDVAQRPEALSVAAPSPSTWQEDQLIERVLADLQRQVELMLEYRLREVLAPLLARTTETLIRESRVELATTLRDVVARAVAHELSRHRGR